MKIKHNCTVGDRCKKFGCMSHSLSLSAWHDKKYEYMAQKHQIFCPANKLGKFLADLKKDKRLFNLKILNSQIYFIEKRLKKEIPSSFYNSNLFFTKPVFVDKKGFEKWELVSREKKYLENFIKEIKNVKNIQIHIEFLKPYKVDNSLLNLYDKSNIEKRTEGELDQRLSEQLKTGHIEGDQWYRDFQEWLLIAFNNPYNFKYPNSELILLTSNQNKIYKLIKNHLQVHYGAGVGETELEIARWQLDNSKRIEISVVDINGIFLELFLENLKSKKIEFPHNEILFKGYNTTFQNTTFEDFRFKNSKFKKQVHICLGGTIGNFKHQEEIWSIFKRNMHKGDKLLLGFQLDSHIKDTFKKYTTNKYYPNFVLNYFNEEIDHKQIKWKLNRKSGFISMNYKKMEVFRTRRYNLKRMVRDLKKFGFMLLDKWVDKYKSSCIVVFEKRK